MLKLTVHLDIQGDEESVDAIAVCERIWQAIERQRQNAGLTGDDENAYVRGVGVDLA